MRKSMAVLAVLAVLAIAAAAAQAATPARHCHDVGPAQTDVGLYKVTAQRITCRKARAVLRHWYYDRHASARGPRGWECRTRRTGSYSSRTTCHRQRATIGFTRYSA